MDDLHVGGIRVVEKRVDYRTERILGSARHGVEPFQNPFQLLEPIALAINEERMGRNVHDSRSRMSVRSRCCLAGFRASLEKGNVVKTGGL
jgi:hypothetical protein